MPDINNSATANYIFDGESEVLTATSNNHVINLQTSNGLAINKTANPTEYDAGDIINYTVQITNTSSNFLNGVRIIDNIGGGNLAYVLGSARLTVGTNTYPVNPVATNPLTFTLQQLGVGATMTLTYRCQVIFNLPPSVLEITNTVEGIGYTATGTVNGFDSTTIEKKTDSDLTLTKSSSVPSVVSGQTFSYLLLLENSSNVSATVLSITDNLPVNFNLTSVSLRIGSGSSSVLNATDYTISGSNVFTLPSGTGPLITVPANNSTLVTLTGYFD